MLGHSPLSEVPLSTPVRFIVLEFRTRRLSARSGFKRFDSDARPTFKQVVFVAQETARLARDLWQLVNDTWQLEARKWEDIV